MKTEIEQFNACEEAVKFRSQYNTFEEAWNACPRGDWMLWIAKKLGVDKRILTLAKGHCANTVRQLMRDERSIKAVDAAIAYGNGEIDNNELETAAAAAVAAYAAATYASDAAYIAAANAAAAYAAADTADAAAAYDYFAIAKGQNQKETADICRTYLTEAVLEKIKEL